MLVPAGEADGRRSCAGPADAVAGRAGVGGRLEEKAEMALGAEGRGLALRTLLRARFAKSSVEVQPQVAMAANRRRLLLVDETIRYSRTRRAGVRACQIEVPLTRQARSQVADGAVARCVETKGASVGPSQVLAKGTRQASPGDGVAQGAGGCAFRAHVCP